MQFTIPARWAAGVVLGASLATAGNAAELSLPALARQADRVFVGTVQETRFQREAGSGLIFTKVRFGELEVLKGRVEGGSGRETLSLRLAGGRDRDGTFVQVSGVPRFHTGERYLVFEKQGAGSFCPLVGWDQGCYRLAKGGPRGRVVMDASGTPVVAIRDGRIERPRPPREAETHSLLGAAVPGAETRHRRPEGPLSCDLPLPEPAVTRYTGAAGRRMATTRPTPAAGAMPASAFLAEVRRALAKG
jgi:hypothetical protein